MNISIVIPTFNSWLTLKDCLKSLQSQTIKPQEVIVVDNGSLDDTSKNVRKYFPKVKIITLEKNTGVTGGRNTGLKAINKRSDYALLFDHDMLAEKDMVSELIKVAADNKKIGMVTPKIYYDGDHRLIWAAGTGMNLWTGQVVFRGGKDRGQYDQVEKVEVAPAAMLIKREVLKRVGVFDDRYFATYEDTDYSFRVRNAGFDIYYVPQAVAYHKIPLPQAKDESVRLLKRSYWVARNRILFMRDHGHNFYVFLLFLPIFFAYYTKLAIKYKQFFAIADYARGTFNGLRNV